MPRPIKCRKVCRKPKTNEFFPSNAQSDDSAVIMTVDEYEAVRLIDYVGMSQEQCSEKMQIARTTVQKIYESARKKLADMIVNGSPLKIDGGDYRLCNGDDQDCKRKNCCIQ